ncbi:MAG: polysaccharide biosynthesis protein [Legionellales bacterium]|nr:polysaccharide biosynthesis protein [Legionellales bacterium]
MNKQLSQQLKKWTVFLHDTCMVPIAWLLAYWLRYNMTVFSYNTLTHALTYLPILLFFQIIAYWFVGLYRGVWRFASSPDLIRIIKAVLIGVSASTMAIFFYDHLAGVPRSVIPLYAMLLIFFLGGSRFAFRYLREMRFKFNLGQRILIVGAGQAGEAIVRDLKRQRHAPFSPIAFVDDNHEKQGREIHGIRVAGKIKNIPRLVKKFNIDLILIALPSAKSKAMRRIVSYCEKAEVPFRTLPSLIDLAEGKININTIREVSLEDLLGREPVTVDWDKVNDDFLNKTILVTGGGGSIGSELCRQIAKLGIKEIIIIDHSEFNLYKIDLELKHKYPNLIIHLYLTSITNRDAIKQIFSTHKPAIVYHAAAYKHVPLLENQISIAIENNILGTKIIAEESVLAHVEKFILISTDKAVNPTSIMGTTKRAAEVFCQNFNFNNPHTKFITVRFGNVLGSAGSVVPLFKKQLNNGGPLTVTHPDITRYFMTIPEACQLILQAMILGKGGEIFVLDMGEPIKISYLAEKIITLAGKRVEEIGIKYIGLRPGEKLYEELFHKNEALQKTIHNKILQAKYRSVDWKLLNSVINTMAIERFNQVDPSKLIELLNKVVPEKISDNQKSGIRVVQL